MDWNSVKQETIKHLQNLIRINTTNPPGNEIEAVKYIAGVLKKENIPYEIFEPAPTRASLIARLKGCGSKRPLLLTSHLDVVPAEEKYWDVSPFSGDIHEGCLWGRGAVDMKHMAAMELVLMLMVKKSGVQLSRDLIFAAVADEEAGCHWGSQWLVTNKPQLLDAEYALNEVGGFSLHIDGNVFYPIGVAEKGVCWFKVTSHGDPGHGSLPHHNQAVVKLAGAAQNLGNQSLPFHAHPLVNKFVGFLAAYQSVPRSFILKLLRFPFFNRLILKYLIPDKKKVQSFHAMYHNTVSPTIFKAGSKVNVIPSLAELEVDGRILPGQTVDNFIREVKKIIGHGFEIEILNQANPTEMEYDNELYHLMAKTLIKHDKRAIPVPYLIPGFTDASYYAGLGIKCYGFTPLLLDENLRFSELFHGHNERVPVEGLEFGVKVLWDVINEI